MSKTPTNRGTVTGRIVDLTDAVTKAGKRVVNVTLETKAESWMKDQEWVTVGQLGAFGKSCEAFDGVKRGDTVTITYRLGARINGQWTNLTASVESVTKVAAGADAGGDDGSEEDDGGSLPF